MAVIPDIVLDTLAEPGSVKMVGTADKEGKPNVVVITTIAVLDPETIAFADLRLGQTKVNLKKTGKLTVTVIGSNNQAYQILCRFVHFEDKTPLFDTWYNAVWEKVSIQLRGIAIAKVLDVIPADL